MNDVRRKINLFVGSDIVAHREMEPIVSHIVERGLEPVLYYPDHKPSSNPNSNQSFFADYAYIERKILAQVVYPFLEQYPIANAPFATPLQVAEEHGMLEPRRVESINNPKFLEELAGDPSLLMTISLRCTQMFNEAATNALKAGGKPLINLHSGILPDFRGLYSTPRATAETLADPAGAAGEFGCTLHHIEPYKPDHSDPNGRYTGIDTGNIIDVRSRRINPNLSVYDTNLMLAAMGATAVNQAIDKLLSGESLRGYPQDDRKGRYYSYASPDEIAEWEKLGVKMYDTEDVVRQLIATFSVPGTEHANQLEFRLRAAMQNNLNSSTGYPSTPASHQPANNNGGGNNGGQVEARSRFRNAATDLPAAPPARRGRQRGANAQGQRRLFGGFDLRAIPGVS